MSIVHLPTCPRCKSMMRQVRVCVRETTRYRVFECLRCYAELMWAPELRRNEDVAVERGGRPRTLTVEEFLAWQRSLDSHGLRGLRTTRYQQYRNRQNDPGGHGQSG
jgi:hypothetical protein